MCHLFKNPTMPLGRKILLTCLLGRAGLKKHQLPRGPHIDNSVSRLVPHLSASTKRRKKSKKKKVWELHVYMCFELCLIHNWKAINLQRPQNYFYNNKCTLLVGLFKMAQTRSPRRWYAVLIGAGGGRGIFFPHL